MDTAHISGKKERNFHEPKRSVKQRIRFEEIKDEVLPERPGNFMFIKCVHEHRIDDPGIQRHILYISNASYTFRQPTFVIIALLYNLTGLHKKQMEDHVCLIYTVVGIK
jgi:hypothetical protein